MGWLSRLFSNAPFPQAQLPKAPAPATPTAAAVLAAPSSDPEIPAAKVGLQGEFDENGLAKRVASALDADPDLDDVDTLWVAQLSSQVILNGRVPSQEVLDKIIVVAMGVSGATEVDASQVTVG